MTANRTAPWIAALVLALTVIASLFVGRVNVDPGDVIRGLMSPEQTLAGLVVTELRLPRAVLAILVGAALGLSGAVLQGLLRNPLAEPGLLGVSNGAALGAVLSIYFGLSQAVPLATLAALPPRRPVRVIAWSGGDSVPGRETLSGHIIAAAGAVNIAARPGQTYSAIDVEELLAARPDALLYGGGGPLKPSVRGEEGQHRVLRRLYAGRRIVYSDIAHTCGLPQSARSALDLRRALDALPEQRAGR